MVVAEVREELALVLGAGEERADAVVLRNEAEARAVLLGDVRPEELPLRVERDAAGPLPAVRDVR